MTPTLLGRWQTRLLLLGTIGVLVSLIVGLIVRDFRTPLSILGYVLVLGFVWDIIYTFLQTFRWDRDWPPAFQLAAGIVEFLLIWALLLFAPRLLGRGLPGVGAELTYGVFITHYIVVWVLTFLASQGLLRIIFPRWRFYGGQWI